MKSGLSETRPSVSLSKTALAWKDISQGLMSVRVWSMLAWQEIRHRYRRSVLGPFWLTISTAVMVIGIGVIYGAIFGSVRAQYLPYLAVSLVIWMFISGIVNESCQAFIVAEGYIKQMKLPLSIHVMRVVWRNIIIMFHNVPIIVVTLIVYKPSLTWHLLEVPIGLLFIAVNGIWLGLLLGILCARYWDIPQMVGSVVQLAFFVTPILWQASMLSSHRWVVTFNPLYYFMEIVRAPLLGFEPVRTAWLVVIGVTLAGSLFAFLVFSRFRARIAYWV